MEKDKENNNYWSNDVNAHVVDRIMNGMDLGNIKNKENCERQISREDIYRAVGVLETNCWEIFGNGKHGFRGIFPLVNPLHFKKKFRIRKKYTPNFQAALMSHDCIPNAKMIFTKSAPYTATLKALVDIPRGREILACYTRQASSCSIVTLAFKASIVIAISYAREISIFILLSYAKATPRRRKHITDSWHFQCTCRRQSNLLQPKVHLIQLLLNCPDVKIQQKTGRSQGRSYVPPASGPQKKFTHHWIDGGSSLTRILTTTLVSCCQKTPFRMDQNGSAKSVVIPVRQRMPKIFAPDFQVGPETLVNHKYRNLMLIFIVWMCGF